MDLPAGDGRIEEVALGRLRTRGFALTTLADIASAAAIAEADLRRLYGDREGLMAELVAPLLSSLNDITVPAANVGLRHADELRRVIEEYLDALVAHRDLASVILGDPAAATTESVRLVRLVIRRLRDELARAAGSDLEDRIRAVSALGAVQAAVLEPSEFDPAMVRDVITDAAVAILLS